ncbi:MAG TPA: hypothetical protein VLT36_04810, partial [Candidatus Dormibacteraeota bacterium]|nr:hypothetical protein [Candidatus Dormibacteraeota bacterium]
GEVAVIGHLRINGQDFGTLWKAPFRAEVTRAILPGENVIEVSVANLWINRMIGDEQLPEDSERNPGGTLKKWPDWVLKGERSPAGRVSFTSWRLWKKDSPLQKSGLLGPVRLSVARDVAIGQAAKQSSEPEKRAAKSAN